LFTRLIISQLSSADPTAERTIHTLRSSNLPFYTAVWDAAKGSASIVSFNKRFYWDTPPTRISKKSCGPKKHCALVDIVAQSGEEWIKVSTITETRLLFDLAKSGWEGADSSSNSDGEEDGIVLTNRTHSSGSPPSNASNDSDEEGGQIELLRLASDLRKASRAVRIRYKHPSVRFVLPKISEGHTPEIDKTLTSIRATGATVQCGPSNPQQSNGTSPSPLDYLLDNIFPRLIPDPHAPLTPTLNIDCTILLALVSDLSHQSTAPEPWFHAAIRRQIDLEAKEQLLPSVLWPAMSARELVCTEEAAARMREIVNSIGTGEERQRTCILLGDDASLSPETARQKFQELSKYSIPSDWNIPIRTVKASIDVEHLDPLKQAVAKQLTAINQSVFFYGWLQGITTMSSNRTVAKLIEGIVEGAMEGVEAEDDRDGHRDGDGEDGWTGPEIWLCETARSLVGKEKGRRG
jgi:hypothetical protein